MLGGQVGCARLSPPGPALLLLLLGAGTSVTIQDICSSPGDLPAPRLSLNTTSTRKGEMVLFLCTTDWWSLATRVIFCKDGVEEYRRRGKPGQMLYFMLVNTTLESAGTYRCGYQHRNESKWVRSSALSAPRHLTVSGDNSSSPEVPLNTGPPMPLWVWILRSAFTLLLLASVPITDLILESGNHCASGARQPGDIPVPTAL